MSGLGLPGTFCCQCSQQTAADTTTTSILVTTSRSPDGAFRLSLAVHQWLASEVLVILQGTSQCKTWNGQGDATAGTMQSAADVEVSFSTDSESTAELISVEEVNAPRSKGNEFILRHITKFQEIVRDLNSPALAGTARTAGVAAY